MGIILFCVILIAYKITFREPKDGYAQQTNQLHSEKPAETPKEKTKFSTALDTSLVIHITKENIEREVYQSNLPVVLDVYSTVCQPCKQLAPIIEELAHEYQGTYKFAKLNIDKEFILGNRYKVRSLPTLIFIKNNEIKGSSGFLKKEEIKERLKNYFA